MTLLTLWRRTSLLGAAAMAVSTCFAQDYFREFGTSRSASGIGRLTPAQEVFEGNDPTGLSPLYPETNPAAAADDAYNFRLGPVDFTVAAGLGIEFNDNINLSEDDRVADIVLRPALDLEGVWHISETNRLRFGVGLSYAKYLSHSEYDSEALLISPSSAIAYTFVSGAFTVTLRERLSYQEDPYDVPVLSGVANYRRWENQAGIQVDWAANERWKVSFGYDRYDLWAQDDFFRSQDRAVDTVFLRPSYQLTPDFALGLNTSLSWVKFRDSTQSDALVSLLGPYILWNVDDYTDIYAEVGFQRSSFDGESYPQYFDPVTGEWVVGPEAEQGDANSIYTKLEVRRRPTEYFRHKLAVSKTTEVGFGSNYYDLFHAEWSADWKIAERTSLNSTIFYQYYETSGEPQEKAHRTGAAIGVHHIFSEHFTAGLDYRFLLKESNAPKSDYYQNLAMLSFYYKF